MRNGGSRKGCNIFEKGQSITKEEIIKFYEISLQDIKFQNIFNLLTIFRKITSVKLLYLKLWSCMENVETKEGIYEHRRNQKYWYIYAS